MINTIPTPNSTKNTFKITLLLTIKKETIKMKMKTILTQTTLALTLAFSANAASAASIYTECNICTNNSDYELMARSIASSERSDHMSVLVGNYKDRYLKKYLVMKERRQDTPRNGRGAQRGRFDAPVTTTEINPTQDELDIFERLTDVKEELALTVNGIKIPSDVVESGYDLISAGYNKTAIKNHINNQLNLRGDIIKNMKALAELTTQIASKVTVGLNMAFEVSFSDGSTATIEITSVTADSKFTINIVEVVDSDGNILPENRKNLTDSDFLFGSANGNYKRYLKALGDYGVPVVLGSGKVSGTYVECKVNDTGGLTCVLKRRL